MAIQIPNPGTGNGATGDNEFVLWSKVKSNFEDQTNAASRLVGTATGNVMPVGAFGLGALSNPIYGASTHPKDIPNGFFRYSGDKTTNTNIPPAMGIYANCGFKFAGTSGSHGAALFIPYYTVDNAIVLRTFYSTGSDRDYVLWHSLNTTKDANGFIKGASPIVKVFADKVELNDDAVNQNVAYKKNGIGDYTITTVSGLSTDGWYIEIPKDMNGNPKVAIGTLDDKDGVITLKTYKRIFSMETFTFEPDLDNPLDIPDTRWIDLRLNEIPVEMPDDIQTEV